MWKLASLSLSMYTRHRGLGCWLPWHLSKLLACNSAHTDLAAQQDGAAPRQVLWPGIHLSPVSTNRKAVLLASSGCLHHRCMPASSAEQPAQLGGSGMAQVYTR